MARWYQSFSCRWYAAYTLRIPTANVHVPNVLDERGVAGEGCGSALVTVTTEGRRTATGSESSSYVVFVVIVFVILPCGEEFGWPIYNRREYDKVRYA